MPEQIDSTYTLAAQQSSIINTKAQKKSSNKRKKVGERTFESLFQENLDTTRAKQASFPREVLDDKDEAILIKLQDAVFSAGDTLKQKTTLETIKEYKKAVSDFLSYMVSRTYDFKQAPERMFSSRKPKSSTIKVINEKLEKLTSELLSNQARQLDILARIDEIKGLIIDLLR